MNTTIDDSLSLILNEQRLANIITVINLNILSGIARNLNDKEKKLQQQTQ